jgi:hypothetical protein
MKLKEPAVPIRRDAPHGLLTDLEQRLGGSRILK